MICPLDLQKYLSNKKVLQREIISLLSEDKPSNSLDFTKINKYIDDQKIHENPNEFR